MAYLVDSPERSAVNGQLPHSAAQGCQYCLQTAKSLERRMCHEYDAKAAFKIHADVMEQSDV